MMSCTHALKCVQVAQEKLHICSQVSIAMAITTVCTCIKPLRGRGITYMYCTSTVHIIPCVSAGCVGILDTQEGMKDLLLLAVLLCFVMFEA